MMKHKLIGIILLLTLLSPAIRAEGTDITEPYTELPAIEEISERRVQNQLDEDITTDTDTSVVAKANQIPHKQPISKRKLIKLFLKAMVAVGISCIALYTGLMAYNRIHGVVIETAVKTPEGETPLSSPDSLEGAVKIFLEKTKW